MHATKLDTFPLLTSHARSVRLDRVRGSSAYEWKASFRWEHAENGGGEYVEHGKLPTEEARVAYLLELAAKWRSSARQLARGERAALPASRYTASDDEVVVVFS